jgi:hypothetical protein
MQQITCADALLFDHLVGAGEQRRVYLPSAIRPAENRQRLLSGAKH